MTTTLPTGAKERADAATNRRRVGIYGGSFDPIHSGHLGAARHAQKALQLDEVVFVPTGVPPHKAAGHWAAPGHRCNMAKLAIADEPVFSVSDIEVQSATRAYTVDTVRSLVNAQPQVSDWYFIFGDDCAANLHRWKGLDELLQRVHFISICRHRLQPEPHLQPFVSTLEVPPDPASSRDIRQALANGITSALPLASPVLAYIEHRGLYGCHGPVDKALYE